MLPPPAAPRVISKRREKITALPLYHCGHLLKKFTGEKDFHSFFGELRGSTIFLYSDDKQDMYSEKIELCNLKAIVTENPGIKVGPAVYTLMLLSEQVQLKIDSLDTGEEWKGFIMTIANLKIPSKLQLLPGQMLKLEETLEMERKRTAVQPPSVPWETSNPQTQDPRNIYDDVIASIPSVLFVSRQEAERMLEKHPGYGSIILRPATDNVNYAITLRQIIPSGPVTKHFKVRSEASAFVIELDSPVTVPTLSAVLEYFVKQIPGNLRPYVEPKPYETRIDLCPPVMPPERGPLPAKPAAKPKVTPHARVVPMIRSPQPATPGPSLPPKPQMEQETENEYIEPDHLDKGPGTSFKDELDQTLKKRREQLYSARKDMECCSLSNSAPTSGPAV